MDDEPGRLVDDEQIRILVGDPELDVGLRDAICGLGRRDFKL